MALLSDIELVTVAIVFVRVHVKIERERTLGTHSGPDLSLNDASHSI